MHYLYYINLRVFLKALYGKKNSQPIYVTCGALNKLHQNHDMWQFKINIVFSCI